MYQWIRMSHNSSDVCSKSKKFTGAALRWVTTVQSNIIHTVTFLWELQHFIHRSTVTWFMLFVLLVCLPYRIFYMMFLYLPSELYIHWIQYTFLFIVLSWHLFWTANTKFRFIFICSTFLQNSCIHSGPPKQWHSTFVKKQQKEGFKTGSNINIHKNRDHWMVTCV